MYNMHISILGYRVELELLILMGIIYLILVAHTLCSCCDVYGIMEGFSQMATGKTNSSDNGNKFLQTQMSAGTTSSNGSLIPQPLASAIASKKGGKSSTKVEGFTGANTNYGESSAYNLNDNTAVNTSSWFQQDMTVTSGKPVSKGVKEMMNRPAQPVPLPEGELLMFSNTEFKPECCPNTYSNSTGCACMTTGQYNYLITRGGNNVPYSEY